MGSRLARLLAESELPTADPESARPARLALSAARLMHRQPLQTELSKLLREQEQLLQEQKENSGEYCYALERNNEEVWTLRNKYACGSTWQDRAFHKWWIKQVAKARNLNIVRQIFLYAAIAAVGLWFIIESLREKENRKEYLLTHPDAEEVAPDDN